MQVLICPHCKSKIKFAGENLPRKVTCPGCKEPFAPDESKGQANAATGPKAGSAPKQSEEVEDDFDEVDDDEPEAESGRGKSGPNRDEEDLRDAKRKANRREEEDEEPQGKRRERDEEDVDERRSKRPGRNENDDEERSRKKERQNEDEERGRKRRNRDEDVGRDNDGVADRESTSEQFKKTLLGLKLINFAFWAQVAAFGALLLLALGSTLKIGFVADIRFIVALGGIPGWLLGVAGGVFLLLGYKRGNLPILLIALIAVAGLHLIIDLYLTFASEGRSGSGLLVARGAKGNILWEITATLFFHCQFVMIIGLFPVVLFFGTVFELARFVLLMLVLRQYAGMCRDKRMAKRTIVFASILVGTFAVSFGLFAAMLSGKPDKSAAGAAAIVLFIAFASYTTVYVLSAVLSGKVKRRMEELASGDVRAEQDEEPVKRSEKKTKKARRDD